MEYISLFNQTNIKFMLANYVRNTNTEPYNLLIWFCRLSCQIILPISNLALPEEVMIINNTFRGEILQPTFVDLQVAQILTTTKHYYIFFYPNYFYLPLVKKV